jgi:integrase
MRWGEIDGEWWTLPSNRVKNKREHRVPFVPSLRTMIEALPRDGDFVFESRRHFGQPSFHTQDWFPQLCRRR